MQRKMHPDWTCYLAFCDLFSIDDILEDDDGLCDQLYAEIKIMRTLRVKELP